MTLSPLAGKPAPKEILVDLARLEREYYARRPDLADPNQLVSFGTSGHRGSPLHGTFTEAHILAITQAICDYRRSQGTDGPLYMGKDTHALSGPAQRTALEVLAANGVETIIQRDDGVTPTPVISRAILVYNRGRTGAPGGRHRHHAVAQSARGRRLQVQPAQRRPGRHRRDAVGRGARQRAAAGGQCGRQACALRRGHQGGEHAPGRFRPALRRRPAPRHRHGRHPRRRPQAGRGSAGRRRRALLGADQRRLRPGHCGRQPDHRSDLLVHDGRSRRQDPHGLLQPLCHGPAGRPQGPVSPGLRQRPGRRPARHRHAQRRPDEPQPLPGRGHPLPAHAPPPLAGAGGGRQDAGQQQHDRPGGAASSAGSSARCRSASSGSRRACSTARAASAARRVPGPASCGATARCGRPTRTA